MAGREDPEQAQHPPLGVPAAALAGSRPAPADGAPGHGFPAARDVRPAFVDRWAGPSMDEVPLCAVPESVATARRVARRVMDLWGLERHRDVVVQLVAELVTNAVRHAGGPALALAIDRRPGWLRVEVKDSSRMLPCLITMDPDARSGRGMLIVDGLADRWGADLLPRGKCVWCEVRLRER